MADVAMDVEEYPAMAPDDAETWLTVLDVGLRHAIQVDTLPIHPDDILLQSLGAVPPEFQNVPEVTPKKSDLCVLVNEDAHIPSVARSPYTAPYILSGLRRTFPSLIERPSVHYATGDTTWDCPHPTCGYREDLMSISTPAADAVCRQAASLVDSDFLNGYVDSVFVQFNEYGRYKAQEPFLSQVVDLVGLHHYHTAHLRNAGLRYIVYGQDVEGLIKYAWMYEDFNTVLQSHSLEGMLARQMEEAVRQNVQRALSFEARRWAHTARRATLQEQAADRAAARKSETRFLEQGDELPDEPWVRSNTGLRQLTTAQAFKIAQIGTLLHEDVLRRMATASERFVAQERYRALADEMLQSWESGEGFQLTQYRGNSPDMYKLPI